MSTPEEPISNSRGVTRWTRLTIGLQVALLLGLGLVAAVLLITVFDRPGLRARVDLSADAANSLDPATFDVVRALPREIDVDVFFRAPAGPERNAFLDAIGRARDLLTTAEEQAPGKLFVNEIDLADLERVEQRVAELGLDTRDLFHRTLFGDVLAAIVLSAGERRTVLRVIPDMGRLDYGRFDPYNPEPAQLADWRGEEALAEALGRVASESAPRILFVTGHGEFDPKARDDSDLGIVRLAAALRGEGFQIDAWDPDADTDGVPSDCDVLVVAAPEDPLPAAAIEAIDDFVGRGGNLLVVPGMIYRDPAEGGITGWLAKHGMRLARGIICVPVPDPRTGQLSDGVAEVAQLTIPGEIMQPDHIITKPLWERDRRVRASYLRSFDRGALPPGATRLELVPSPPGSWRDLPESDESPVDLRFDQAREDMGQFALVMVAELPTRPNIAALEEDDASESSRDSAPRRSARIAALGGPSLIIDRYLPYNRDLVLNVFNWLSDRDFRVRVSARDPFQSRIDVSRGREISRIWALAVPGLPGLAVVFGVLLFWRRRS